MVFRSEVRLIMVASILALSAIGSAADDEAAFRAGIEARKDRLLAAASVQGRVMTSVDEIARAKRNVKKTDWGRAWFASEKEIADYIVSQPDSYIESMVPELTPTSRYGFTCPHCVGVKSQEGGGAYMTHWDYRKPDVITCLACGQTYPDPKYPEEGRMECPRMGQTFTYYITDAERRHPEDHSGKYAWHWVNMPIRVSFEGIVRREKACFAVSAVGTLGRLYDITGDQRYARTGIKLLERLAQCYRKWLYHDYWATFADCDPMYAAWHDKDLPRAWKRNPSEDAFKMDTADTARMLQSYWGAGRIHPSTDNVGNLAELSIAYDAFRPLMTTDQRRLVERDLLLEWLIGAEPFVGGKGKTTNLSNKSPRIYLAMAAVGKCLGIPDFVETALRGYEGIRDQRFLYDGFSRESPAYTQMYLGGGLIDLVDNLQGYRWPDSYDKCHGILDLYGTDAKLRLMFRSVVDQLRGDGRYLPLSDTQTNSRPSAHTVATGIKRYPEYFEGKYSAILAGKSPSDYAVFTLDPNLLDRKETLSPPEILYPAWMTAILRNGAGPEASVLALTFNPWGGHRHTDNLGLYYSDRGAAVLDELGYVGDMPVMDWAKKTLSHNLVIVDDSPQISNDRVPKFELMATTPRISVAEASSSAYPQCSEYRRLVALVKGPDGQTFAIDIFRVAGGKKHAYQAMSGLASSEANNSALVFDGIPMPPEPPLPQVGNSIKHEDIYGLRDVRVNSSPPASWEATWKQPDRSYRLWMVSPVDRVEASNGPGQTAKSNGGRRTRYLNAIREGDSLRSMFVVVHEPSGIKDMPIRRAIRLQVPGSAGPNAVAIRIESDWGVYYVFSEFDQETNVDGIRFHGRFGAICDPPNGKSWFMAVGATTLQRSDFGFTGATPRWSGKITRITDAGIETSAAEPDEWPNVPAGCRSYATVNTGENVTGFAAAVVGPKKIRVDRFPVPESSSTFDWLALRFMQK